MPQWPTEEEGFLSRMSTRRDGQPRSLFTSLVIIALLLTFFLISLPLIQEGISNPVLRWTLLLMMLALLAFLFLRLVAPRPPARFASDVTEERPRAKKPPSEMARKVNTIERALAGQPFSQMLAYSELKQQLEHRIMVRRQLSWGEMRDLLDDPERVPGMMKDREMAWLLTTDFYSLYEFENIESPEAKSAMKGFNSSFKDLLSKVEGFK